MVAFVALAWTMTVVAPVMGHISIPEGEVPSGVSSVIHIRVPHGCDGASTDTVEVQVPVGVVSARPEYIPGWTVETEVVESEPYEHFGETLTERVGVVRWSGGDLPDSAYYDFGIQATILVEPGTTLAFPVLQRCGDVEVAWIEPVIEGDAESEHPAPTVAVGDPVEEADH